MSDFLEKIIQDNKQSFEEEPAEGHFARFEDRLNKSFQKKSSPDWKTYLQIAASILLVLLIANQARIYFNPEKVELISLSEAAPEYTEVEYYYTSSIENSLREWEKLSKEGFIDDDEQALMKQEMQEFDRMYEKLQIELQANPDDERVVNAMLEYYQAKLSIITLIIDKLQQVKQQKLTYNETEI